MKCISIILLAVAFWSCNNDDCEDMLYDTGPVGLDFKLVDEMTDEDLFVNGTFNPADLSIVTNDDLFLEYDYYSKPEFDLSLIKINLGFDAQAGNAYVKIANDTIFSFHFKTEISQEKCFSNSYLKEIDFPGTEYEYNNETGVYLIKL
jgi:hypothetical protein